MYKYLIEVVGKSDKGSVKEVNQDNFLLKVGEFKKSDFGLFVICDGLGGLSRGEVASRNTIAAFEKWWNNEVYKILINETNDDKILNSLENVLFEANNILIKYAKSEEIKIGTTASALLILKNNYYIVHIGDSRIYKIENDIKVVTKDHTYYQQLRDEGKFEESRTVKRSILTQCIGSNENIEAYKQIGRLSDNSLFVLCSDGLYKKSTKEDLYCFRDNIEETSDYGYMNVITTNYINKIKERGERDNISLLAVKVKRK